MDIINSLQKLPEPKKTFLEILKVHDKEIPIANLLAYFFRNEENHNLGDLFIKTILNTTCYNLDNSSAGMLKNNGYLNGVKSDCNFSNLSDISVKTEVLTKDDKRIDILISTSNFVICIEFKINHDLNNPLEIYQNHIESEKIKEFKNKHHFFLILTPNKKEPIECAKNYINKGHNKFKQVMLNHFIKELCLAKNISNNVPYFNDFIQTIQNREIRYKRTLVLKKLIDLLKCHNTECEFHPNTNGGYLKIYRKNYNLKIRLQKNQFQLEKWSLENEKTNIIYNGNDTDYLMKTLGNNTYK